MQVDFHDASGLGLKVQASAPRMDTITLHNVKSSFTLPGELGIEGWRTSCGITAHESEFWTRMYLPWELDSLSSFYNVRRCQRCS